jgi:hypothetical protein
MRFSLTLPALSAGQHRNISRSTDLITPIVQLRADEPPRIAKCFAHTTNFDQGRMTIRVTGNPNEELSWGHVPLSDGFFLTQHTLKSARHHRNPSAQHRAARRDAYLGHREETILYHLELDHAGEPASPRSHCVERGGDCYFAGLWHQREFLICLPSHPQTPVPGIR